MPLPPRLPARPPFAEPPAPPGWRWLLLLGLVGLILALTLGIIGLRSGGTVRPAAGFGLGGMLLVVLGLSRWYRASQALTWHSRERRWH